MMWFRQLQIIPFDKSVKLSAESLQAHLALLPFTPCLPSLPMSFGWIAPDSQVDDAPLVFALDQQFLFCMQIEEKILPASVIRHELNQLVKNKENKEGRKIPSKEKLELKEDLFAALLPRAFSKTQRIYAYIDNVNHHIVLGTTNAKQTEYFLQLFKKTVTDLLNPLELKNVRAILTSWLSEENYPASFGIEKQVGLQDPQYKSHTVSCKEQDLQTESIRMMLQEGLMAKNLALNWHDRLQFVMHEDFSLRSVRFEEEFKEAAKTNSDDDHEHHVTAEFLLMTQTLNGLIAELLPVFTEMLAIESVEA